MKKRRIVVPIVVLLVAAVTFAAVRRRSTKADPAATGSLHGTGTVEATEIDLGATIGGRLVEVTSREGQTVSAGQVVARLDTRDLEAHRLQAEAAVEAASANLQRLLNGTREEQVRAARAALDAANEAEHAARAKLEQLQSGARPAEKRQAEAAVAQADAALAGAEAALRTATENHTSVTALKQQLDAAEAAHEAALAQRDQARARLELVRAGPRQEQIHRARSALTQAEAARMNAKQRYERVKELFADGAAAQQMLDDADAALKAADAAVAAARAQLSELQTGSRPEDIAQAEAALSQAQASVAGAEKALANAHRLHSDRLEARAQVEAAETQLRVARQQREQAAEKASLVREGPRAEEIRAAEAFWQQARAQTRAAKAQLDLLLAGERPELIEAAQAEVKRARGLLRQIETALEDSVVVAPQEGVIAEVVADPGEVIAPGATIVRLLDLQHVWLKVYIPLVHLGQVKLRQPAKVVADTYPDKPYAARVIEISEEAEFTPKNVQTKEQRVQQVFWVKLGIENPNGELKPGMPAEAHFD